jgi:alpha-1,4-digalacturonate transport system permease protein
LKAKDAITWVLLVAGALVMFFPIYWMFATAIRPADQLFNGESDLIPERFLWSNFVESWNKLPFEVYYFNSIAIALIAVVVTVFIKLLAGYTFAKYKFWGRDVLFLSFSAP